MAETKKPDSPHILNVSLAENDSPNISYMSDDPSPRKIFVKNLDKKLSEADVQSFFQKFGRVTYVRKPRKSKAIAFVTFANTGDALKALKASNEELVLGKRQLSVEVAKMKKANTAREKTTSHSQLDVSAGDASWWIADEIVPIHRLPYETLDHVLSFLSVKQRILTELVCKRWRMVGKNLPWGKPTKLILDPNWDESALKTQPLSDSIISAVLSRCGISLRQLTIVARGDRHTSVSSKSVKAIGKYCPNLVEVKLVGLPITNQCLKMLAQGCAKLKSVTLQNSFDFGEEGLSAFLKRSEALECLEISKNYQVKGECLEVASKTLQKLRINDCSMLQTAALHKLMAQCDGIQELRFTYCHQLDPDVLMKLFHHYRHTLRIVYMDGYAKSANWGEGLGSLRHLGELSLRNCYGVTDEVLRVVAKKCANLRSLNIRGTDITDMGLAELTSAPHLTTLDISENQKVTGDSFEVLAAQGGLQEVYIRGCLQLTSPDSSCAWLARLCPNMRLLDVSGTLTITNALVELFQDAIKNGFLKGNVKLVVGGTLVEKETVTCDRLELSFENTSQRDLILDLDYYDSDYSNDDDSNIDYDFDYYDSSIDGDYGDYDDYDDYADYDDLAFIGPNYNDLMFGEPFYFNEL